MKHTKRDAAILIRVSRAERARIRAAAKSRHLKASPLVRMVVLQWIDAEVRRERRKRDKSGSAGCTEVL